MVYQADFLSQLDEEREARIEAQRRVERESVRDSIRATLATHPDWFCGGKVSRTFGWSPSEVANVAQQMHDEGMLERRQHFYGSPSPGSKDYRGFRYEFKVTNQAEG